MDSVDSSKLKATVTLKDIEEILELQAERIRLQIGKSSGKVSSEEYASSKARLYKVVNALFVTE